MTETVIKTIGAVDVHFHGAFGIDLMTAGPDDLDRLSRKLWANGIAAFCPTTLSTSATDLIRAVTRLGAWIRSGSAPGALPLGIHLEGPFLSPAACGAHPPHAIRRFSLREAEGLWRASQGTIRLMTVAPERVEDMRSLIGWARRRRIRLSLGHSQATEEQARTAFDRGFTGVTHAWNAMAFHHRRPGVLGAALGRDVFVEVILDGIHVSPTVVRWVRRLHSPKRTCLVSDCTPAAACRAGSWHSFGPLRVENRAGASRLKSGELAGGGVLLTRAFQAWFFEEARISNDPRRLLREVLPSLTTAPLAALGISEAVLKNRRLRWNVSGKRVTFASLP